MLDVLKEVNVYRPSTNSQPSWSITFVPSVRSWPAISAPHCSDTTFSAQSRKDDGLHNEFQRHITVSRDTAKYYGCKLYSVHLKMHKNAYCVLSATIIVKKGPTSDPNNFRPISLTATCCRVMERIINNTLLRYLLDRNLISKQQHGFIRRKSVRTITENSACSLIYCCLPVRLRPWTSAYTFISPYLVNAQIPTSLDLWRHCTLPLFLSGFVHVNKTISYLVHLDIYASLPVRSFDLHAVT